MSDLHNTMCVMCGRHHPVLEDCRDYVLMPVDPEWRPTILTGPANFPVRVPLNIKGLTTMRNITIHLINAEGAEIAVWSLPAPHPALRDTMPIIVTWADTGRFFTRVPTPDAWPSGTRESDMEPRYRECEAPTVIGRL